MARVAAIVSTLSLLAVGTARGDERLLVLDRWQTAPGQFNSIARLDPYDPLAAGSSILIQTTGTLWSMPAPVLDLHSLAVHPTTGQIYTVARMQSVAGAINAMVSIDRDTGALGYIGAPCLDTARFRFDPLTLAFHWVNGKQSRIYTAPGGSNTFQPDLHFPAGDPNAGASPSSAGFAFEPPMPGVETATAYVLDATTDSLCTVDFATSELRTIGPLGVDLTGLVAGPVVELGGAMTFVADLGAGPRRFTVDHETGVATDAGAFPALHGVTDMVFEPDLAATGDLDADGYRDFVEVAAGSNPGDAASAPFALHPTAPAPTASLTLVKDLQVTLDFAAPDADTVTWKGRLSVPDGFVAMGQRVIVEVGDYAMAFTLGKKGKAANEAAKLELGKKVKSDGTVTLKVKLKQAALAAWLEDEGLVDADTVASAVTLPVAIWIAGSTQTADVPLVYDAAAGVSGVAE